MNSMFDFRILRSIKISCSNFCDLNRLHKSDSGAVLTSANPLSWRQRPKDSLPKTHRVVLRYLVKVNYIFYCGILMIKQYIARLCVPLYMIEEVEGRP